MKKIFLSLLALWAFIPAFSHSEDWAQFGRYEKENKEYSATHGSSPEAVFMGSSIIECWTDLHPDFYHSNNYLGRGISGHTTYQMLLRFRDDVINFHPQFTLIYGGSNDIAQNNHVFSEDRTLGNLISMAELARANGIQVYLCSVLPASNFYWRPEIGDVPAKIINLNKKIRAYAEANDIPYLDFYSVLVDENGAMKKDYTKDGVHPNSLGYEKMEEVFLRAKAERN